VLAYLTYITSSVTQCRPYFNTQKPSLNDMERHAGYRRPIFSNVFYLMFNILIKRCRQTLVSWQRTSSSRDLPLHCLTAAELLLQTSRRTGQSWRAWGVVCC